MVFFLSSGYCVMIPMKPDFQHNIHDGRHVAGRFLKKEEKKR
jgi:hypothetical protein